MGCALCGDQGSWVALEPCHAIAACSTAPASSCPLVSPNPSPPLASPPLPSPAAPRSEYLAQQKALHHLAAEWSCALPRGLQACLGAGPAAFPGGKAWDAAACAFGQQHLRGAWGERAVLGAMAAAYQAPLGALRERAAGPAPEQWLEEQLAAAAAGQPGQPAPKDVVPGGGSSPGRQEQWQRRVDAPTPAPPCVQLTAGAAAQLFGAAARSGPLYVQVTGADGTGQGFGLADEPLLALPAGAPSWPAALAPLQLSLC